MPLKSRINFFYLLPMSRLPKRFPRRWIFIKHMSRSASYLHTFWPPWLGRSHRAHIIHNKSLDLFSLYLYVLATSRLHMGGLCTKSFFLAWRHKSCVLTCLTMFVAILTCLCHFTFCGLFVYSLSSFRGLGIVGIKSYFCRRTVTDSDASISI
jgi:hypothetical protein